MLALDSSFVFTCWFCSLLLQSQVCIHTDMNSLHQCISFYSDMEFLRSHQYLKTNNFVTIYCIYIIQLLFFAKKNIKMRFLVCSIIPYIFYFKVLSLDWQLIYKRILIQSLTDFAVFSFKTMFAFTPIWIHFINAFSFIQAECSLAVINIWKQTIPLQMFCWNW